MIREFTPEETAIVNELQEQMRIGAYGVSIGFRAGLEAGVKRALAAAEAAPLPEQIAAIQAIIAPEV